MVVNLVPPAILVGEDVIRGARMQELAFMVAKSTYLLLPQHFLTIIDDGYETRKARLAGTFYTLSKLANPAAQVKHDPGLLKHFTETIPDGDRAEFMKMITEMSKDPARHLDISSWLVSVEHTANRLGLLFANDLESAARIIKGEASGISKASVQDRVRELVVYSLSSEYFQLRKALGFSLDSQR